jgi:hypothetical protein
MLFKEAASTTKYTRMMRVRNCAFISVVTLKKKTKMSACSIKHHAMKTYEEVAVGAG